MGLVWPSMCGRPVWSWVVDERVSLLNMCWCACEVVCVPECETVCVSVSGVTLRVSHTPSLQQSCL